MQDERTRTSINVIAVLGYVMTQQGGSLTSAIFVKCREADSAVKLRLIDLRGKCVICSCSIYSLVSILLDVRLRLRCNYKPPPRSCPAGISQFSLLLNNVTLEKGPMPVWNLILDDICCYSEIQLIFTDAKFQPSSRIIFILGRKNWFSNSWRGVFSGHFTPDVLSGCGFSIDEITGLCRATFNPPLNTGIHVISPLGCGAFALKRTAS